MEEQPHGSSQGRPSPEDVRTIRAARTAVAARLLANQSTLLAFIRRRLGHAAASERDAEDVFATTLRRSDALVAANALLAELPDAALLALASAISRHAILESSRQAARTRRIRASASDLLRARVACASEGTSDAARELSPLLQETLSEGDLAVIALRLNDLDWSAIAATLGTTPAGAHRRYYRAMQALAEAARRLGDRHRP